MTVLFFEAMVRKANVEKWLLFGYVHVTVSGMSITDSLFTGVHVRTMFSFFSCGWLGIYYEVFLLIVLKE